MTNLSKLVAGTMNWGTWGKNLSADGMSELIHLCLDNDITTFDHADIYGGYTTEKTFGEAFSRSGIARDSIQLISKCGIQYPSEMRKLPLKYYDYSAEYIIWSAENSLRNLQTDYLDVLLLHRPSPLMQTGEISQAVTQLLKQGKIKSFGVSNFTPLQTELIRRDLDVAFNQIQFSIMHHEALTDGALDYMQLNGIRPMAWSPLGNVFKNADEQAQRINVLLESLEKKYDAAADQILLAWILRHPSGILPVFGTADPSRIAKLMKATQINLEQEDWFSLWVESRGAKVP